MFDKLETVVNRYEQIAVELSRPETAADNAVFTKLMKEHAELTPIVDKYREYTAAKASEKEALEILSESGLEKDFKELAEEELKTAKADIERCSEELKILLLPKDPNDDKNVIVEIRGGAGGEEAALFAGSLYRMYTMYSESKRWSIEVINANETELGGYKEIVFMIEGAGAYSRLKYESGVHRVQRVPDTETQGRIHTSTVTVAVLPEAEDVELEINPADLKIDTFRSSGAGGQHINKTSSAIRVTHIPTGTVVAIELDERLKKILPVTLADCNNVEIIYGDVLKTDLKALIAEKFSDCLSVAVCANLPYYITSPIVMSLLESKLPIDSITVMVQKEAAERLCAKVGTREAGAVSAAVAYYSEPEILFGVDKNSFMPPPKVDSAVIQLHIRENPPVTVNDEAKFFRLIRACFAQRRKTLVNTVSNTAGIDKENLKKALAQLNLSETVRGEKLTLEELAELSNLI